VALIPYTASLILNIPLLFKGYNSLLPSMVWSIAGFFLFVILFFIFGAPVKSYILEHELSHMLFAVLSGTKIRRVSFSRSNAYVKTDRVNLFIALAPYSLPLYTLFVILVYKIVQLLSRSIVVSHLFYLVFGMTLSFHFIATIHYLQLDQPDMRRYGTFPSMIFIVTWAIILLALIFALMFEEVQVLFYFRMSIRDTGDLYRSIVKLVTRSVFFS